MSVALFLLPITSMIVLDFESFSEADLSTVGAHRYATDPTTGVLVLAWSRPGEDVRTWVPGHPIDPAFASALERGEDVLAHNAEFDRAIWEHVLMPKHGWPPVTGRWRDSMTLCALLGLPRSLEQAALALGLGEQKQADGKQLVRLFSMPHGDAFDRVRPADRPEDWGRFVAYCVQDVRTTVALVDRLRFHLPQLDLDHPGWEANWHMAERGVQADLGLVESIIEVAEARMAEIEQECVEITGGISAGRVQALIAWFRAQGLHLDTLGETDLQEALARKRLSAPVRRVLELRLEGSRSAWRKCYAIREMATADGRLHNQLAYGATHTYRWAGRGVQLQNLPRPRLTRDAIETAIAVLRCDPEAFPLVFKRPMEALSSLMRSVLCAPTGRYLGVCDFGKIEVVVLAWLAGDHGMLEALGSGDDLYRELAARIYGVPVTEVTPDQRFTGKSGVLGGGFGAGWRAFQGSCRKQGVAVDPNIAKATIAAYRDKHAPVVRFWSRLEAAAIRAVATGAPQQVGEHLTFSVHEAWLFCRLPSGRLLAWFQPRLKRSVRRGRTAYELRYTGVGKNGKPVELHTFGGRLCENVVSSTARDLLAESLVIAEREGLCPVLTVHDEIVAEGPPGIGAALREVMRRRPDWGRELPIEVEHQEGTRYEKR